MDYNSKIFTAFSRNLATEIVNNPEGCTLPGNLGHMRVVGNTGGSSINREAQRAMLAVGKEGDTAKVAHANNHTDGKIFKIEWYSKVIGNYEETIKSSFFNSDIYVFKSSHFIKRALVDICLHTNKWADYFIKIKVKRPKT